MDSPLFGDIDSIDLNLLNDVLSLLDIDVTDLFDLTDTVTGLLGMDVLESLSRFLSAALDQDIDDALDGLTPFLDSINLSEINLENLNLGDLDLGDLNLGDLDLGDLDLSDLDFGDFDLGNFDLGNLNLEDIDWVDTLGSVLAFDLYDAVSEYLSNSDSGIFNDLVTLFDGVDLSFLDSVDTLFSDLDPTLDLSFLTDVINLADDLNIADYVSNLFDDALSNDGLLDDDLFDSGPLGGFKDLVESLDDVTELSEFVSDRLIEGSYFKDILRGSGTADILLGLSGHDTLNAREGNDFAHGGAGRDRIKGHTGADVLFGHLGRDELFGGRGKDAIAGGVGTDELTGGNGADTFFLEIARGKDFITDLNVNKDVLALPEGIKRRHLDLIERETGVLVRLGQDAPTQNSLAFLENIDLGDLDKSIFVSADNL
ncbi:MAG: calcium-binding protein [Leptolyngbyaceae bacterium]|nr:calcium-binding protein [Leptolyngbyaceae bacterium]